MFPSTAESALAKAREAWELLRARVNGVLYCTVENGGKTHYSAAGICVSEACPVCAVNAALARAAPASTPPPPGEQGGKKHRCMRCDGEFACRTAGCEAKYDVLPRIVQRAPDGSVEVVEHECVKVATAAKRKPADFDGPFTEEDARTLWTDADHEIAERIYDRWTGNELTAPGHIPGDGKSLRYAIAHALAVQRAPTGEQSKESEMPK